MERADKSRRPTSVTVLAIGVLTITGINLLRFWQTIQFWEFLGGLLPFAAFYLLLTGGVWAAVSLPLLLGLWRGFPWAPKAMQVFTLAYGLYYWLDRLLLRRAPATQTNWPFMGGVTILSFIFIHWTLKRSKVRAFFNNRRENEY